MTIKVNFKGIELTASSPEEAALLAFHLSRVPTEPKAMPARAAQVPWPTPGSRGAHPPAPVEPEPSPSGVFDATAAAIGMLEAIEAGGPAGVPTETIMKVLGADHPKGIGSKAGRVNELLRGVGFKQQDIYETGRSPTGTRWLPGRAIRQAISSLKQEQESLL